VANYTKLSTETLIQKEQEVTRELCQLQTELAHMRSSKMALYGNNELRQMNTKRYRAEYALGEIKAEMERRNRRRAAQSGEQIDWTPIHSGSTAGVAATTSTNQTKVGADHQQWHDEQIKHHQTQSGSSRQRPQTQVNPGPVQPGVQNPPPAVLPGAGVLKGGGGILKSDLVQSEKAWSPSPALPPGAGVLNESPMSMPFNPGAMGAMGGMGGMLGMPMAMMGAMGGMGSLGAPPTAEEMAMASQQFQQMQQMMAKAQDAEDNQTWKATPAVAPPAASQAERA